MKFNPRTDRRNTLVHADCKAALKALQAVRTTSPLVRQCKKALNDISARHVVGFYWVPGHAGVQGNEIADGLERGGYALGFLGPEPVLGVSTRVIRKRLNIGLVGVTLEIPKDRLES
jgi:hypothetical protein